MNIQNHNQGYILGQSPLAEQRLNLLNEITSPNFINYFDNLPKHQLRILNVGCGSGHLEERLASIFSNSRFIGIDISPERIQEACNRTKKIHGSNTFEFIQADLTTFNYDSLQPFDMIIFRFVLSHISNPLNHFERILRCAKKNGIVCFQELASDGTEYYCNPPYMGYDNFIKMVAVQRIEQKCAFQTGFLLLKTLINTSTNIMYVHLDQSILRNSQHKSILRLGVEEAKTTMFKHFNENEINETINSLKELEEDSLCFCIYSRSLIGITSVPSFE